MNKKQEKAEMIKLIGNVKPFYVETIVKVLYDAGYRKVDDVHKETAKEILQTLYDECYEINDETGEGMGNFVSDDDILCLAKHYGVEVNI